MRSTSSFCHRINLLNEDLNVRASSLGGVAEAEELHPEPPFPPPVSMFQHLGLRLRDLHGDKTTEDSFKYEIFIH